MAGLYDNYKLQNSTQIKRYVGAPIEEMTRVGGYLQEAYTQNREGYDTLDSAIGSANVLDSDKALFKSQMSGFRTSIGDAATAGNYEDMGTQVRQLSRKFGTAYSPFVANAQAVADEDKDYEERVTKGLSTSSDIARAKRARGSYKGLQLDADGRYTNAYKGKQLANYVDVNEKILKALKELHPEKHVKGGMAGTISTEGGKYFIKGEHGTEEISKERVKEATNIALSDNMVQAYMKQDAELDYAHINNLNYSDLSGEDFVTRQRQVLGANGRPVAVKGRKGAFQMEGYNSDTIKGAAKKYADQNGVSFSDAYKMVAAQKSYQDKVGAYQNSFGSYAYRSTEDRTELGAETAGSQEARSKRAAKALKETDDLVFETNTTSAPEKTYSDYNKGITNGSQRLTEIDRQLSRGNLQSVDRDKLSAERSNLSAQVTRDKKMMLNTANKIAADLPDVIKGAKIFRPGGGSLYGENTNITRGVIVKAIAEGKITTLEGITHIETPQGRIRLQDNPSFSEQGKRSLAKLAKLADAIGGTKYSEEFKQSSGVGSNTFGKIADMTGRFEDSVAQNSKMRQSTTLGFSLKENHKKQLTDMYNSNSGAYEVYLDGQLLEDGDKPSTVSINQFNTERAGTGNNYMTADAKDEKGKKLEGNYRVVLKGQNNLNGQLLKQYAPGTNGTVKQLTVNNPVFDAISTSEVDSPVSLPRPVVIAGHAIHGTMKETSPNGNTVIYFLDKNGNRLKDNQGDIYVNSPLEAASFLHQK